LEKFDKLVELIIKWNTTKKYSNYENSCQHFSMEVLEVLEMSPKKMFKGQLSKIIL
jgi:hypothetical protein